MRCIKCGVCCQQTDMLLTARDITRLEKKGYNQESFVRFNKEGYAMLRNRQGNCVFYNVKDRSCDIYSHRPSGCRVYPVILDEDKGIIVDEICHAQASIADSEKAYRGKCVLKLLKEIDSEADKRRKSTP
ncbi:MAG TPA: YkgJ family cysteine cluster protein [Candidatus Nanoarchaeia archaeon]|nr:YkgJ family cysteine cluster protein [Candidatus Nanoarchaeia archaeon]